MISRYGQRRRKLLQDPEVAEGYREMAVEFQFMQAIEAIRSNLGISKENLASQMGKKKDTISIHN